jgi:hypothetical protein
MKRITPQSYVISVQDVGGIFCVATYKWDTLVLYFIGIGLGNKVRLKKREAGDAKQSEIKAKASH